MNSLHEEKIKIGDSMKTNIEYFYDKDKKRFYSKHNAGAKYIEQQELSLVGLLNNLKKERDRLEWTDDGKKLFPELAPKGKIGRKTIDKGEKKMMKTEIKAMIKEELRKVLVEKLLVEKFESKKLAKLATKLDMGRNKNFFSAIARTYDLALDLVPDTAVGSRPDGNKQVINLFFVNKSKVNPFKGASWDGTIYPGLIGATIGKKHAYIATSRWNREDGARIGTTTKGSDRMGSQTAGVHNFKRYSEVADEVVTIDLRKANTGATAEKKADRKAAKQGATALMNAKEIAGKNRDRYEQMLRDRLAQSSPGDQIIKMVDAVTKMYTASIMNQVKMLKQKKVASGWNDSATLIMRAKRDIMQDFEYYLRAENDAIRGKKSDKEMAKKLAKGDKKAWSEEAYYQKQMIKYARQIQQNFKKLKADLKKLDTSKDYIDLR